MKKRIVLLAAALTLFTAVPFSSLTYADTTTYSTTLYQGMSGQDVTTLQQNLQTLGYYTYSSITGYFGSVTKTAVINLQRAYGLKADGIVGTLTQTEIKHALVKKQIIEDSYSYLNIPYQWGGYSPSTGFDCSGFVYYMFSSHGVTEVPRTTSPDLYKLGKNISIDQLQPGDLVFFSIELTGNISHVGIYIGSGKFISPIKSKGVYVQNMINNSYWSPRYLGAKRVY